jgi:hypothetical protein
MTVTESQVGLFQFFGSVNESLSITDSPSAFIAFFGDVAEQLTMLDSSSARADFIASTLELLSITDSQCPFGWFKINDNQVPSWGVVTINVNEVAAYGAFTFGGVPFAGNLVLSGQSNNPLPEVQIPNWSHIDNAVSTSWTEIETNQNC